MRSTPVLPGSCGRRKERILPVKRAIVLLLAILWAWSLTGCGDMEQEKAQPEASAADASAATAPGQNTYMPAPTAMIEGFTVIPQLPELPTGCEITSLAMALVHCGVAADKCDLADHYLAKGEIGVSDFRKVFVGDPRDEDAYGCYAPVIVTAANRYLSAKGSQLKAKDLSGTAFSELLTSVDSGVPVLVWATQDCIDGAYIDSWYVDGEELYWLWPEHCMVLLGYSDYQVWVADPLYGEIKAYDRVLFEVRYNDLGKQAVILH